MSHAIYTITILDNDNPLKFIAPPKGLVIAIIFSSFIGILSLRTSFLDIYLFLITIGPLVQGWFAYRVKKLSGKVYIPLLCWFLSTLRLLATLAAGIEALFTKSIVQFEVQFKWLLTFILVIGAVVDIIVAVSLCYYLRQHRDHSFPSTVKLINQTMVYTVGTSFLSSPGS
jgi:hypothetical protein